MFPDLLKEEIGISLTATDGIDFCVPVAIRSAVTTLERLTVHCCTWMVMLTSASEPSLAADTSISRRVANSGPVMGLPIGENRNT